jgi:hypothetical protein
MNEREDSAWVSGGYLVTRPVAREGTFWDARLVPATFWTASDCLARVAPSSWAISWVQMDEPERLAEAERFGIPRDRVANVITWASSRFDQDFGWPNVFLTLEAAREFCSRFVPAHSDAAILELALAGEDVEGFLQRCKPAGREGASGVYLSLSRRLPPAAGGQWLGAEVLGADHGGFHSSLCNALERDFAARLEARPNAHGLYDDHALARRCASLVDRGDLGAEPGAWYAWGLIRHPR